MKLNLLKLASIAILLLITSGILKAQDDAEGCKDYPLFNRMQNYYIYSCEELEFGSIKFPIGKPDPKNENKLKTEAVEGRIMVLTYALKDDAKPASGLQLMRNFQNASKQNGGVILGEYPGWCTGSYEYGDINSGNLPIGNGCTNWGSTFKFTKKDKEIWAYVQYSDNGYDMVIAEKTVMKQDIQANEMFEKIDAGKALTLYINFETGKAAIKPESENIIDELYRMLEASPNLKIMVEGHTDNVGNPELNQTLSEQRASSVKLALVAKGISSDRIQTIGYGQDKPIADNTTEDGKAKNRRVEIRKQ